MANLDVGAPIMSESEAEARFGRDKYDVLALAAKGDHRVRAGDHRAAAAFYSTAVSIAQQLGAGNKEVADAGRRAGTMLEALAAQFREHMLAAVDASGIAGHDRPERFQQALEILLGQRSRSASPQAYPQLPKLFFYPGLPHVDFADPSIFPWRSRLEAGYPQMREEAVRLLADHDAFSPYVTKIANRPQADAHGLLDNRDWSSFYLWQNGEPVKANAERCPTIFSTLTDNVPLFDVKGRSPSAYLSLLRPGAHIPPHTGMLNCRYICHLPLIVPPDCRLRVGGRQAEWQEGKLLAFDDTVEHEAWNRSAQNRLIILFEVWVPDLSETEKTLIRTLLQAVDSYGRA